MKQEFTFKNEESREMEFGSSHVGWERTTLEENSEIKHGFAFKGEFFTEYENENILLTPGNFKIGGGLIIQNLNIMQAIFKHWFVDFEFPNEDGKPYRSSGVDMRYLDC